MRYNQEVNENNEEKYRVNIIYDQDGERILSEFWYNNKNESHRLGDLPAIVHYDEKGNPFDQHWLIEGSYHRTRGPAIISTDPKSGATVSQWIVHGKLHRDGMQPALVVADKHGKVVKQEWCVNGQRFKKNGMMYKGP